MYKDGRKAVSTVIAAMIVTGVLLALFSGLLSVQTRLHQAEVEAVRREAERAMEAPFQIYWINSTHVRLFNNHSSVPVILRFWVTSGATVSVTSLDPSIYSVGPGTFKDVKAADPPRVVNKVYKVVSERGSVFVVGDMPSEPFSLFKMLVSEKQVRPGFTSSSHGPLTSILLGTGPEFGGGQVSLSCVSAFPPPASCVGWSISFNPSSPVYVPSGGALVVNVLGNIPVGTPSGTYFIRLRADTGGFVKEFLLQVMVGDFTFAVNPGSITIGRGCAGSVTLSITPTNYGESISFRVLSVTPADARFHFAFTANPLDLSHGEQSTGLLIYINFATPNTDVTRTVVVQAYDGLGPSKTASITVTVNPRSATGNC